MGCRLIQISSMLMMFLLLINIDSSLGRPSTKLSGNEVQEICSTTQNPSFCVQTLNSDPRTAAADLKGLAGISIDMAKASAKETATLISSLVENSSDPKLKGRYQTCAENYDDSIDSLDDCTIGTFKQDRITCQHLSMHLIGIKTKWLPGLMP